MMRLQKFLARAGVASRRHAEELIVAGRVMVNGQPAELGCSVDPGSDEIRVDGGAPVRLAEGDVTIMLHKPAGYVTTMDDPQGRATVADLVPADRFPGLFPVGRLDRDTTGLLLFTTDGELGNALLHPRRHVEKRYLALVEGTPDAKALERLRRGVVLSDGMTLPARAELLRGGDAQKAARAIGTGKARAASTPRILANAAVRSVRKRGAMCSSVCERAASGRFAVCSRRWVIRSSHCIALPLVRLSWGIYPAAHGASSQMWK